MALGEVSTFLQKVAKEEKKSVQLFSHHLHNIISSLLTMFEKKKRQEEHIWSPGATESKGHGSFS